jgi:hypothetical protein
MRGSLTCNKSKTRIWVIGRGVSFRSGFSSRRRGVSSSGLGPCDFLGDIGIPVPKRHHASKIKFIALMQWKLRIDPTVALIRTKKKI